MQDFVPTAWLKRGCPYSFRFLVFMAEASLVPQLKIVEMVEGEGDFAAIKASLTERLGKPLTFPTVEVEPGRLLSDSDELIRYFCAKYQLDCSQFQALPFYERGLMPRALKLIREHRSYREKYGALES